MVPERSAKPAAGAPRIAALEDDPSQAKLLQHWIASQGWICRHFDRGQDILRALLKDTYDLVILDWRVPDLSGEEVLRALRKSVREPLPVLFTTGRDREEDIVHALKAGADDYLIKPLRRMEFLARVEALLRRSRALGREAEAPIEAGEFRIDPARPHAAQERPQHRADAEGIRDGDAAVPQRRPAAVALLPARHGVGHQRRGQHAHRRHACQSAAQQARPVSRVGLAAERRLPARLSPGKNGAPAAARRPSRRQR